MGGCFSGTQAKPDKGYEKPIFYLKFSHDFISGIIYEKLNKDLVHSL
jgi:hypothetical protein